MVRALKPHTTSAVLRVLAAGLFLFGGVAGPAFHRAEHAREDVHSHDDVLPTEAEAEAGSVDGFLVSESASPHGAPCVVCAQLVTSDYRSSAVPAHISPKDFDFSMGDDGSARPHHYALSIRGPPST